MLRQNYDDIMKGVKERKRPLLDKQKETRNALHGVLEEDVQCMTIDTNKYLRVVTQNSMKSIKMDAVKGVIESITREDVMSSVKKGDTDVWQTLCNVVKRKINDERRNQTTTVSLSKTKPRGVESVRCTPEAKKAVEEAAIKAPLLA